MQSKPLPHTTRPHLSPPGLGLRLSSGALTGRVNIATIKIAAQAATFTQQRNSVNPSLSPTRPAKAVSPSLSGHWKGPGRDNIYDLPASKFPHFENLLVHSTP